MYPKIVNAFGCEHNVVLKIIHEVELPTELIKAAEEKIIEIYPDLITTVEECVF